MRVKLNTLDRIIAPLAPRWAWNRAKARAALEVLTVNKRHYEATQPGRRTSGWQHNFMDADQNIRGANYILRQHTRDLIRNNSWARRGQRVIANNTVGWGIAAKPVSASPVLAALALELWNGWAGTTDCDSERRQTFSTLQHLAMKAIASDGEILFRRRWRKAKDRLTIPFQIQVLEGDFLDHSRNTLDSLAGGPTIQGVEFDKIGRRAAYWLFDQHPGSGRNAQPAKRVLAEDVIHVYYVERPGQTRGVSWFGSAVVNLKDLDEFEDASLMQQKIAACFAAFVTDDGTGASIGIAGQQPDGSADSSVTSFEPGMIETLPAGKDVRFANPPPVVEGTFSARNLRKVAAGLGVTYEDLTGDYSQVNFSSARMARLSHWANVHDWRWNMLIPQMCQGVWDWFIEGAIRANELPEEADSALTTKWTPPPMPMIEPDKEGLALQRLVRTGALTHDEMVREQGYDPNQHWTEYADGLKRLDGLGIVLDSDPRRTTANGQAQQDPTEQEEAQDAPEESTPAGESDPKDAKTAA